MRTSAVTCPVCGTQLRGHPSDGYRCARCHAFYSTRHVRAMRREQFRELVHEHFGAAVRAPKELPPREEDRVESDLVIREEQPEVEHAIAQAKRAAADAARHLDDFVEVAQQVSEDRSTISAVAAALPIDRLRHEPVARTYRPKVVSVRIVRKRAVTKKKMKKRVAIKSRRAAVKRVVRKARKRTARAPRTVTRKRPVVRARKTALARRVTRRRR